jgi:hypothetical protein
MGVGFNENLALHLSRWTSKPEEDGYDVRKEGHQARESKPPNRFFSFPLNR